MQPKGDLQHLEFEVPSRGLIGLRTQILNVSAGEAIMAHRFKEFVPYRGDIPSRQNGAMIAMEGGDTFAYAIDKLQDRGKFFVEPGESIYSGQVVGEHNRNNDLPVNLTKSKKLTNMRASGSDDKMRIAPAIKFSLEEAMEYIQKDEYVEITPKSLRIRKIYLDENERKRMSSQMG
jgi:GTP-binding protein